MKVQLKEIKNIRNLVWILFWLTIVVELASIIPVIPASSYRDFLTVKTVTSFITSWHTLFSS